MQYLYVIKCQDFHKIGIANDVESRLAQLSTGNPYPLEVVVVYAFENAEIVERAIHQRYKEIRQRGEWFRLSYDDLKNIHSVCLALGGSAFEYTGRDATEEAIEEAEETAEGGSWYELVKVKNYYYLREMGWDKTTKKKVYIRNIGSLEECKLIPEYSEIAYRLEAIKFAETIGGKDITQLTGEAK